MFLTAFAVSVRFIFMIFNVAQPVNCYTSLINAYLKYNTLFQWLETLYSLIVARAGTIIR